jgi:hypothetical protein
VSDLAVVIPNHLPHLDFLGEWDELKDVPLIVVQDIGAKPEPPAGWDVQIVDHADIASDLGDDSWIIPSRSSACRSYGYLLAWRRGVRYVLTLDNDCYPDGSDWVAGHVANLERPVTLDWVPSDPSLPVYSRGFPYQIRDATPVALSHGLWSGVPDLDAATALHHPSLRAWPASRVDVIPRWSFFPMCGMNLAWRAELTSALYFGLFGPDYGFDQYDDIWAGVLVKRVLDHLGWAAVSGYPSVEHRKQSDVYVNLAKQTPGLAMNEQYWRAATYTTLSATTPAGCYAELISQLPHSFDHEPEGWTVKFKQAARIWLDLFA